MFVYVEWKIDLTKPNRVNILRILREKDTDIKYEISRDKFLLGSQMALETGEYDQDSIYFTRVKVGKILPELEQINMLTYEHIYSEKKKIQIYLFGNKGKMTSKVKCIIQKNIMLNPFEENYILSSSQMNMYIKELKKNNVGNYKFGTDNIILSIGSEQIY